jgi:hypothetical protein
VRGLAVVESSANAIAEGREKILPRRAAFEHEPESAAARGVSGARGTTAPGVLHGRQATLKDEHPSPTP